MSQTRGEIEGVTVNASCCGYRLIKRLGDVSGVDFKVKMMQVDGKKIKMTIWDTAGQERFRTLTSSYYRGAQGIVLVYDVARRDTFENLDLWLQEVEVYSPAGGRDVVKLLVGNKIDKERVVSRREAEDWARSKGMLFVESSAKTKIGIQQVFNEVVQKVRDGEEFQLFAVVSPY
ncbi:hypothetical protein, variant 7 [Phytophthora nicotianae P1976]|uniref:Uncharacterized protein n=1 Tax=Phytophthora nicotianae P1976 TaxID=1317066 RepID=A0A081AN39_PHYNI|nr:hypothetical protein, variant 7 [Phytophthora nicotianae P1976]